MIRILIELISNRGNIAPQQGLFCQQCLLHSEQEIVIIPKNGLRNSVEFLQLGYGKFFILGKNRFGGCSLVTYDTRKARSSEGFNPLPHIASCCLNVLACPHIKATTDLFDPRFASQTFDCKAQEIVLC